MTDIKSLTVAQLRKAITIKQQIEELESELTKFTAPSSRRSETAMKPRGRRKMSAAAKARIAAAQKARWAKFKRGAESGGKEAVSETKPKKRREMSAAAKAKIAEAAKARWAKAKAEGKTTL